MFNFIICDNDSFFLIKLKVFIEKNVNEYESIITFKEYTNSFFKVVNDDSIKNKFYILDIETAANNGIIIASKIRSVDRNSIIVFVTGYEVKYSHRIAKSRFRYDALINKFDNYENELLEVIRDNKKYINMNRRITIKLSSNTTYIVELDSLLYLKNEKFSHKLIIQTFEQQFKTYNNLKDFENQLSDDFVKINRSCVINKKYAKIDYKQNTIRFTESIILIDAMSQTFVKKNK